MPIGLYIHVPFCVSKCPYCDFYSLTGADAPLLDAYAGAVERALEAWASRLSDPAADTLYFGGGTPSLLGGERLARLIETARRLFGLRDAEITLEANPGDRLRETFRAFAAAGGNRISLGMQSAQDDELRSLGRRHTARDAAAAVDAAHDAGIDNLSLDLMLALENQTIASVVASAGEAARLGARHLSAYLLKIEPGTPYAERRDSLALPDDDAAAELYLAACETLDLLGYRQYEISNFALPGAESRHNLKYWNAEPTLGIGPSAHSFLGGRRFAYPRDLSAFLEGRHPVAEREETDPLSPGIIAEASEEEYAMLRLRLSDGLDEVAFRERFGRPLPDGYRERAAALPAQLVNADERGVRLTRLGFLLSNPLIARLLG